mmetsp:Transcript_1620/g.4280  ORF Transcript_1620/g.4280 Transcript_1620/m.4280 type:complete len:278 (-) Transcript_1620:1054-1887(-)
MRAADTIKVKLQNMPATSAGVPPQYSSAMDAVRKTVASEGLFGGLYKGMGAPLATVAVFNAVLFATNGFMQGTMRSLTDRSELNASEATVCGGVTGIAAAIVATPTELIKCRLQAQISGAAVSYSGPVDVARSVLAARGIGGLYKGFVATLLREIPGNALYFGCYEACKSAFVRARGLTSKSELGAAELMVSGAAAGLGFWAGVYPTDVIKTKIQTDSESAPRYRGIADCTRQLFRQGGWGALYRGVGPCLARAVPANAVCFLVYELCAERFHAHLI